MSDVSITTSLDGIEQVESGLRDLSGNIKSVGTEMSKTTVQTADAKKGMSDLSGGISDVNKEIGKLAPEPIQQVATALGSSAGTIGLVAGGLVAAAGAAISLTKNLGDTQEQLDNTASKLGITTEQVQRLKFVAEQSSLSFGSFERAIFQLQTNLGKAADGNEKLQKAFSDLHIDATDGYTALLQLDKALANLEGPERARVAVQLAGTGIKQVLSAMKGDMEAVAAEAPVMSEALEEAGRKADKSFDKLDAAWQRIKLSMKEGLIPVFTGVADEMDKLSESANKDKGLSYIWQKLKDIATMKGPVLLMFDAVYSKIKEMVPKSVQFMAQLALTVKAKVGEWVQVGKDMIDGLWEGMKTEMHKPIDAIKKLADDLPKWAKDLLGIHSPSTVFFGIGEDIGLGLVDGIDSKNKDVQDSMKDLVAVPEIEVQNTVVIENSKSTTKQLAHIWRQAADDMQNAMGTFFFNVLEGKQQDYLQSFKTMINRMVSEWMAAQVAMNIFGGSGKGGGWLGGLFNMFSFSQGGVLSPQGLMPLKSYGLGGIANTPQIAAFGDVTEAFVPLPDGKRIPVDLQGSGGGGTTVTVNLIEAPGKGGQVSDRMNGSNRIVDVMVEQIRSAIGADIRTGGGAVSSAIEHTYGLNRAAGAY